MLRTGDKAPAFSLIDTDGNIISLSVFRGKKVVLYFYPKDNTPGCTIEACSLRDNYALLKKKVIVFGISPDNQTSHQKFTEKYSLPFPLLCDIDHKTAEAFSVWAEKKFMGRTYIGILRTTFVIDEQGKIESVISDVDTKNHAAQILALLK